jgi:hypothetical protein
MDPTTNIVHTESVTTSALEVNNTPTGYVEAAIGGDHGSHRQIF